MANELNVGDIVFIKTNEDIKMVVAHIKDDKAICYYFNRLTAEFVWIELNVACFTKANPT